MANSLQDQLLKSGIINKQKANKVKAEKRKKTKQTRQDKTIQVDAEKQAIQKARVEKAQKDKQLNLQKQQTLHAKAIDAQIRQLIKTHQQHLDTNSEEFEIAYHFQDDGKVKTIYVNDLMRSHLSAGKMAIVKSDNQYAIVSVAAAEKIRELNDKLLIVLNQPDQNKNEDGDDDYSDYEIPSDLIW